MIHFTAGKPAVPQFGNAISMSLNKHKKVKHYEEMNSAHLLTFSCYRGLQMLSKDRTRLWFIESLKNARVKHRFDLWAWVIMPEHVHLLIHPRDNLYKIASILSSIKRPVGFRAIRFLKQKSSPFLERLTVINKNRTYHRFWQAGAGHDRNLNDPAAVHAAVEYIHNNPVRRGLVARIADWPMVECPRLGRTGECFYSCGSLPAEIHAV